MEAYFMENSQSNTMETATGNTKFCKHCGKQINAEAVICPLCGCQVEELKSKTENPNIVINNTNTNTNVNANKNVNASVSRRRKEKNKWVAFFLCFFLGFFGAHKFYEEKMGMGILYLFTGGLFGIGWIIDLIVLICKPATYYV